MIRLNMNNYSFKISKHLFVFILFSLSILFCSALVFSQFAFGENTDELGIIRRQIPVFTADNLRDPLSPQVFTETVEEEEAEEIIVETKREISEVLSLRVQGIIWNCDTPLVIINNEVVKKGEVIKIKQKDDMLEDVKIIDIDNEGVTIIYQGEVEKIPSPAAAAVELQKIKGGSK